jgi:transcriptional regulator with XRE-family HTH domain
MRNHRPEDTFAARLLLVRHDLDLTQIEAAERCGLDDGSWSNWENGTRPRDLAGVVSQISRNLDVDRDWLMWGAPWLPLGNPN